MTRLQTRCPLVPGDFAQRPDIRTQEVKLDRNFGAIMVFLAGLSSSSNTFVHLSGIVKLPEGVIIAKAVVVHILC